MKVYSMKTGEIVKVLRHKSEITGFFFNPSNALQLFSVSYDGSIKLWDFEDGVLLKSWSVGQDSKIVHAVFCPSKRIAYLSIEVMLDGKPQYNISTFHVQNQTSTLAYQSPTTIGKLFLSPRGDYIAVLDEHQSSFHLLNLDTLAKSTIQTRYKITALAFHPFEPCVIYGNEKGKIRANYCLTLASHERTDSTQAGGQSKNTWKSNKRLEKYDWHTQPVLSISFSPDGILMLSGGEEQVIVIWRFASQERNFLPRLGTEVTSITTNDQGTLFALGCRDNSVRIVDARSRDPVLHIQGLNLGHDVKNPQILIDPHNTQIAAPSKGGFIQFYDPFKDKHIGDLEVVTNPQISFEEGKRITLATVSKLAFGPKGAYLVTVDYRNSTDVAREVNLKFWRRDGNTFALNTVVRTPHTSRVTGLACHPVLPIVATCSTDGKFKIWHEVEKELPPGFISKHKGEELSNTMTWVCRSVGDYKGLKCHALAFSSDGSLLALAFGTIITLWDPLANTFYRSLTSTNGTKDKISNLAFIPSSRFLISSTENQLLVWDLLRCTVAWSYSMQAKYIAVDTTAAYQSNLVFPSPSSLVTAFVVSDGEYVLLLSPSSPKPLRVWSVVESGIQALAFRATSTMQPAGCITYLNYRRELVLLELKETSSKHAKTEERKLSITMSSTKDQRKDKPKEKTPTAYEKMFGKITPEKEQSQPTATDSSTQGKPEDVGIILPRAEENIFNPPLVPLSHLFSGPSHLLPLPTKIYSSFMDEIVKKAHTALEKESSQKEEGTEGGKAEQTTNMLPGDNKQAEGMDNSLLHKRRSGNVSTEKAFYSSMFTFFSSFVSEDAQPEISPSLLAELTAPVPADKKQNKEEKKQVGREQTGKDTQPTTTGKGRNRSNSRSKNTQPEKSTEAKDEIKNQAAKNDEQSNKPETQKEKHQKKQEKSQRKKKKPRQRTKTHDKRNRTNEDEEEDGDVMQDVDGEE